MELYNINDKMNLMGISDFIDNENVRDGVNPKEILHSITNGDYSNDKDVDYEKLYDQNMALYRDKFGASGITTPVNNRKPKSDDLFDDIFNDGPTNKSSKPNNSDMIDQLFGSSNGKKTEFDDDIFAPSKAKRTNSTDSLFDFDNIDFSSNARVSTSNRQTFGGNLYTNQSKIDFLTEEQMKKRHVDDIIGSISGKNDEKILNEIQKHEENIRKSELLIDIKNLREGIMHYGKDVDVSTLPNASNSHSIEYLEAVKRDLIMLDNSLSSSGIAEEMIVTAFKGLGKIFDGRREFFGVRPYLKNYHTVAAMKLKTMKYTTSKIVPSIVGKGEHGPLTNLIMKLGPGLLMYSSLGSKDDEEQKPEYNKEEFEEDLLNIDS